MSLILALDQGTTSSRSILFNREGGIVAIAQQEFPQLFPQPGWVEHDPLAIWETQLATAREVLQRAGVTPSDVAAIGITNQRETTVVWDRRTGEPIANAIVWQDRRTAGVCETLKAEGHAQAILERTGLVVDAYFSASKIAWLLDNIPGARARAERGELAFGTIDTWLVWKLTGGQVHVTDASNASRTMLYNLQTGDWDEALLELLRVPRSLLPKVRSSSELYGAAVPDLLGTAVPIAGMAGDQQASLFGQGCFSTGMVKNTYGTGCFMLMNIGSQPKLSNNRLITTVAWQRRDGGRDYALEGSVFIGGAVVQWLRDGLGFIRSSGEVEALAASVPDSGGVYLVPAFAGLGAPHWDPYARGTITGLSRGTKPAHIARAALEGIAFQVADVLEAMKKDAGQPMTELRVDGGACANDLLMQFQADILQVPVRRPRVIETTALGAACLAGLAVGYWKTPEEVSQALEVESTFLPRMSEDEAANRRQRWNQALERSKNWETA